MPYKGVKKEREREMISRSKIAKKLKREIVKNLFRIYKNENKALNSVLYQNLYQDINSFLKKWNVQNNPWKFISEISLDIKNLVQNKSGQFDRFCKQENIQMNFIDLKIFIERLNILYNNLNLILKQKNEISYEEIEKQGSLLKD